VFRKRPDRPVRAPRLGASQRVLARPDQLELDDRGRRDERGEYGAQLCFGEPARGERSDGGGVRGRVIRAVLVENGGQGGTEATRRDA
jgi:hypothetical protein